MIKNFEELNVKIAECSTDLANKFTGGNGMRAVVLCGGTGCISSNSLDIKAKFEKLIEKNGKRTIVYPRNMSNKQKKSYFFPVNKEMATVINDRLWTDYDTENK